MTPTIASRISGHGSGDGTRCSRSTAPVSSTSAPRTLVPPMSTPTAMRGVLTRDRSSALPESAEAAPAHRSELNGSRHARPSRRPAPPSRRTLRGEHRLGRVDDRLHREHELVRGGDEMLGRFGLRALERVDERGQRSERVDRRRASAREPVRPRRPGRVPPGTGTRRTPPRRIAIRARRTPGRDRRARRRVRGRRTGSAPASRDHALPSDLHEFNDAAGRPRAGPPRPHGAPGCPAARSPGGAGRPRSGARRCAGRARPRASP